VPAGQLLSGTTNFEAFGFRFVPRETGFGVGERGVEKGCARPVDVAAGGVSRGGSCRVMEVLNWRARKGV
jgi:hypothetical protein